MSCPRCGHDGPVTDFYQNDRTCKTCRKALVRDHRRTHDSVREYDRRRYHERPHIRARIAITSAQWRRDNPEAYKAHTAVNNAVRDGRLEKLPCEICGGTDVHGHHDDYSKPLDVRWLCVRHHALLHATEKMT